MAQEPKKYLTTKEAATVIGLSESYLNQDRWRAKATGCPPSFPFIRLGRSILYRREDLERVMSESVVAE